MLNSLPNKKSLASIKSKGLADTKNGTGKLLFRLERLKSQYWPTGTMFVYKIQVNPIHTILKYGDYNDFKDT